MTRCADSHFNWDYIKIADTVITEKIDDESIFIDKYADLIVSDTSVAIKSSDSDHYAYAKSALIYKILKDYPDTFFW